MSEHSIYSHSSGQDADHSDESKFHVFVQIAMLLAVITGIEIVLVYLPLAKWLLVGILAILSLVKFMYVIFYFMHLKWDKMLCTLLFFIGLFLAAGTVVALMAIANVHDSKPIGPVYEEAS